MTYNPLYGLDESPEWHPRDDQEPPPTLADIEDTNRFWDWCEVVDQLTAEQDLGYDPEEQQA